MRRPGIAGRSPSQPKPRYRCFLPDLTGFTGLVIERDPAIAGLRTGAPRRYHSGPGRALGATPRNARKFPLGVLRGVGWFPCRSPWGGTGRPPHASAPSAPSGREGGRGAAHGPAAALCAARRRRSSLHRPAPLATVRAAAGPLGDAPVRKPGPCLGAVPRLPDRRPARRPPAARPHAPRPHPGPRVAGVLPAERRDDAARASGDPSDRRARTDRPRLGGAPQWRRPAARLPRRVHRRRDPRLRRRLDGYGPPAALVDRPDPRRGRPNPYVPRAGRHGEPAADRRPRVRPAHRRSAASGGRGSRPDPDRHQRQQRAGRRRRGRRGCDDGNAARRSLRARRRRRGRRTVGEPAPRFVSRRLPGTAPIGRNDDRHCASRALRRQRRRRRARHGLQRLELSGRRRRDDRRSCDPRRGHRPR